VGVVPVPSIMFVSIWKQMKSQQEALLSQRDRAMLRVY